MRTRPAYVRTCVHVCAHTCAGIEYADRPIRRHADEHICGYADAQLRTYMLLCPPAWVHMQMHGIRYFEATRTRRGPDTHRRRYADTQTGRQADTQLRRQHDVASVCAHACALALAYTHTQTYLYISTPMHARAPMCIGMRMHAVARSACART